VKLKHWIKHQQDCRGNPTPERDKRAKEVAASDKPFGVHLDEEEASHYVQSVSDTSDYEDALAWHGWALHEAFLAGITAERDRVRIQGVIDAYINAKDEQALNDAHEGITALVKERSACIRRTFNYDRSRRIEQLMRAAGFSLDDTDWKSGTCWWHKSSEKRTLVLADWSGVAQ
jgi:hypothetical protein